MKLFILLLFILFSVSFVQPTFSQNKANSVNDFITLKPTDNTIDWLYPNTAPDGKKKSLTEALKIIKKGMPISEVIEKLGQPDKIEDLRKPFKNISHEEADMLEAKRNKISFRCIWYARKYSKTLPSLGDSWLAIYVNLDEKTLSTFMQRWLAKPTQ